MNLLILMLDILMAFCGYQISKTLGQVPSQISFIILVLTLALVSITSSTVPLKHQEYLYYPRPVELVAFLVFGWLCFQRQVVK